MQKQFFLHRIINYFILILRKSFLNQKEHALQKTMILFLKNILHQKCIKSVTEFMKNVVFMIKLLL